MPTDAPRSDPAPLQTLLERLEQLPRYTQRDFDRALFGHAEFVDWKAVRALLASAVQPEAPPTGLLSIASKVDQTAKEWARDDRMWNTQEVVEDNLKIFGRKVFQWMQPSRSLPTLLDISEIPAVKEARKALACLFIAVNESVAIDVRQRVEDAFETLRLLRSEDAKPQQERPE